MDGTVVGLEMPAMISNAEHHGSGGKGPGGGLLLEYLGAIEEGVLMASGPVEMIGGKEKKGG